MTKKDWQALGLLILFVAAIISLSLGGWWLKLKLIKWGLTVV